MTPKELEAKFPNLYKLLNGISYDNDMLFRDEFEDIGDILKDLEREASRLEGEEFVDFAMGERSDMEELIQRKNLQVLDEFLTEAFDGKYQEVFYTL